MVNLDFINSQLNEAVIQLGGLTLGGLQLTPYVFHLTTVGRGEQSRRHSHGTFEYSVLLKGEMSYLVPGAELRLRAGDGPLIPPGVAHSWRGSAPQTVVAGFQSLLEGAGGRAVRGHLEKRAESLQYHLSGLNELRRRLLAMIRELSAGRPFRRERLSAQIALFHADYFALAFPDLPGARGELRRPRHGPVNERVQQVRRYVAGNLAGELDVKQISRTFGLSSRQLARIFPQVAGCSLKAHIQQARLENAARLLRTTDLPIKAVAGECGYADPNYFCLAFRSRFGLPPTRYRQQQFANREIGLAERTQAEN